MAPRKGARGETPAFFFSIFLLMPKEIWSGFGAESPNSTGLEVPEHFQTKHKLGIAQLANLQRYAAVSFGAGEARKKQQFSRDTR